MLPLGGAVPGVLHTRQWADYGRQWLSKYLSHSLIATSGAVAPSAARDKGLTRRPFYLEYTILYIKNTCTRWLTDLTLRPEQTPTNMHDNRTQDTHTEPSDEFDWDPNSSYTPRRGDRPEEPGSHP